MTISIWFWVVFNLLIGVILWADLKLVHAKTHEVSLKEATLWSLFWVALAVAFGGGIYYFLGSDQALKYFTGYVIEKTLSVDNLFVFLMVFEYFSVPAKYQARVLHWGILGALVMRFILIFTGVALLNKFHWIIYIFGAMLIYTGLKMAFGKEEKIDPEKNPVLKIFKKIMPVADRKITDEKFFLRINGILYATPLFIVLLVIESSDLIFAIDSIPAVLAVSPDPFIVYTSNVFAILGLRALYFVLSSVVSLFRYLKVGVSILLCYVGIKMLIMHFYKIPTGISLAIIVSILLISILASLVFPEKEKASKLA